MFCYPWKHPRRNHIVARANFLSILCLFFLNRLADRGFLVFILSSPNPRARKSGWQPIVAYWPRSSPRCFSSQRRVSAASPAPFWRTNPHMASVVYAPCKHTDKSTQRVVNIHPTSHTHKLQSRGKSTASLNAVVGTLFFKAESYKHERAEIIKVDCFGYAWEGLL